MRASSWISRAWDRAFAALSLGMLGLVLLVSWSVAARNVEVDDVSWIEDICRLILLWVGLLFIPAIQRDDAHIAAVFLQPRSHLFRRCLDVLKQIMFLAIGVYFVWYGSIMVERERDMFGAGGMELPLEYFNIVIPLTGLLISIVALVGLLATFRNKSSQSRHDTSPL